MSAPATSGSVLLVEDDADLARAIATGLELAGHDVAVHGDGAAALAALDRRFAGVIVSDLRMPGMDGWQFFTALQALDADIPVIFITGHGNIDEAVTALQQGAYDFVAKPFDPQRLLASIARGLEKRRLVLDNRRLRAIAADGADNANPLANALPLAGESPAMVALRQTLAHAGEADIDVLIAAEPGSGRDRVARLLHDTSRRRARAFVAINAAAGPAEQLAGELFGAPAPRGRGMRPGRLALADRGTLFLDSADLLPADLQLQLLAALDQGDPPPDVRVIAATGSDRQARDGLLPDLRIRLAALPLRIPPLRERRDDIPMLFARLAAEAAQRLGQPLPALDAGTRAHLLGHDWPGNLRELAHFAQRRVLGLAGDGEADAPSGGNGPSLADRMARIEAGLLREALAAAEGRIGMVTEQLGLPRKTLYDKLARHGIDPAAYRRGGARG
jgi:two-component system, NtrC family, C4-dicarboxylate transport response regulator DctD